MKSEELKMKNVRPTTFLEAREEAIFKYKTKFIKTNRTTAKL